MRIASLWLFFPLLAGAQPTGPTQPAGMTFVDQGTHDPRLRGYRTPHGFKLEIVADETTVRNPVGLTFSPDGSLLVWEWTPDRQPPTESTRTVAYKDGSTRTVASHKKSTSDPIKRLHLDSTTQRYTKATTLLESEWPTSVVMLDRWLYVASSGTVRRWSMTESGPAQPQVVAHGFGALPRQVSRITLAPDGWLYIAVGAGDHHAEGSDGSRATLTRTGGLFRCQPDGSRLHVVAEGYHQPQGLAHDDMQHCFLMDRTSDDGRLLHVVADRGATVPALLKTERSTPTGLLYYNDRQLPPFYRGWMFTPDLQRQTIRANRLAPQESTFIARHEFELLSSNDPLFRPSQMATGPDGAIYIADWRTDSPVERPTGDGQHGRVYRLTWHGGNVPTEPEPFDAIPRRRMDTWATLRTASDADVWSALRGLDGTTRQHAQGELLRRKPDGLVAQLLRDAADSEQPLTTRVLCFQALGTLWDERVRDLCVQHLNDQEPTLRERSANLLGEHATAKDAGAVEMLETVLADPNKAVRRAAAFALGQLNAPRSYDALVSTYRTDDGHDAALTDGLIRAIERTGKPGWSKILELSRSGSDADRDKAVFAFLHGRSRACAEFVPELLLDPHLTADQQSSLLRAYAQDRGDPPMKMDALLQTLTNGKFPPSVLTVGLGVLADAKQLPPSGVALIKRVFQAEQPASHIELVHMLERAKYQPAEPLLTTLVSETQRSIELRSAAAKALRHGSKESLPTLTAVLAKNEAPTLTIELLRTVHALDSMVAQEKARALLKDKDVSVLREAIQIVSATPPGAVAVGEAFVRLDLPREVVSVVAEGLRKHLGRDPTVSPLLTNVMKSGLLVTTNAAEVEKIRQLVIRKGDASRGRALYLDVKGVACVRCHQIEGVGGNVGPDLSRWWDTATIPTTLEAVLEPSNTVAAAYRTFAVTSNGQTLHGRTLQATKDQVVLRDETGKDHTFARAAIAEYKATARSLMPANAVAQLSFDQFIDLVAFMHNRSAQESLRGMVTRYRIAPVGPEMKWRTVATESNGLLDLPALLPKSVPVEAAFVVHIPKAKALTLYLSAAGPVTVWVNGKPVVERRQTTDNDALLLDLNAGDNEVRVRFKEAAGLTVRWQTVDGLQWRAE